ncbi:MAG: hypothetical protein L0H19_01185, partial [Salinisphaera sp.]|nr:hypothetical protein [Salinisphaera sp.]
ARMKPCTGVFLAAYAHFDRDARAVPDDMWAFVHGLARLVRQLRAPELFIPGMRFGVVDTLALSGVTFRVEPSEFESTPKSCRWEAANRPRHLH